MLDGGGAADGIDGVGEGEKERVADRHDLLAVVICDGVADQAEMLALNAFEIGAIALLGVGTERGCTLGGAGADHVGKDQSERELTCQSGHFALYQATDREIYEHSPRTNS